MIGPLHFARHRLHAVEVAVRGGRETRLVRRARRAPGATPQLLGRVMLQPGDCPRRERGVEDQHSIMEFTTMVHH